MSALVRPVISKVKWFQREWSETYNFVFNKAEERGKLNSAYLFIAMYAGIFFGARWFLRSRAKKLEAAKRAAKPGIVADALARSGL